MLQSSQARAAGSAEEAEVAHFHEAARQDVLEETLDEVLHREATGLELSGVGWTILEGKQGSFQATAMIDGDQTAVIDGNAVDVGGQVFEGSLSITNWFAMHNPLSSPDFRGDLCVESGFAQGVLEGSAEQFGEGFHGQEEVFAGWQPGISIIAYPAAGDQIVHVGMVEEVAGPGMQYAHHPDLPAHKSWISGQFLGRLGRSTEEQVVNQLLIVAGNLAQFRREGEGQQEVRDG